MDNFLSLLFQDSTLLVATLVLIAAIGILLWALQSLKTLKESSFDLVDDDMPLPEQQPESEGLIEARLQEITNQLGEISRRLTAMETISRETNSADRTIPGLVTPAIIEQYIQRLESRIELLANDKAALNPADSITRLEAKMEGIHRLLILLTDSGSPDQK